MSYQQDTINRELKRELDDLEEYLICLEGLILGGLLVADDVIVSRLINYLKLRCDTIEQKLARIKAKYDGA